MINKTKNSQYIFLILTYLIVIIFTLLTFRDFGVHIEEKFHRINGLYWLNYISQIFNIEKLILITIPTEYFPFMKEMVTDLFQKSGFKKFTFTKEVDFAELYKLQFSTST